MNIKLNSILVLVLIFASIGIASAEYTTEQIGYNPAWDKINYQIGDIAEIIISFNPNYFDDTKYFYEVSILNPNTGYADYYNITVPQMRIEYPFEEPGVYMLDVFVSERNNIDQGLIRDHSFRKVTDGLQTPTPSPSPSPTPTPTPTTPNAYSYTDTYCS